MVRPRPLIATVGRAALGCLFISTGSCLLTTDLTGFSGDTDAGASALEGGGVDGSQADGSPQEGGADADAQAAPCAVSFCASFDQSTSLTSGWTTKEVNGAGSIALETTITHSRPHAFASRMAARSDFDAATLTKYFTHGSTELHLEAYIYLDVLDAALEPISLGLLDVFESDSPRHSGVRINLRNDSAALQEEYVETADGGVQINTSEHLYAWPTHTWLRLRVDVKDRVARLSVDGIPVLALTLVSSWNQSMTALKLGIFYSRGHDLGQSVLYDDVTFDAK